MQNQEWINVTTTASCTTPPTEVTNCYVDMRPLWERGLPCNQQTLYVTSTPPQQDKADLESLIRKVVREELQSMVMSMRLGSQGLPRLKPATAPAFPSEEQETTL